jgi:hypothetical protein
MPTDPTSEHKIDPLVTPSPTPPGPWKGRSVMVRHRPDGSVIATSRGCVGVGATEAEALRALAQAIRQARAPGPPDTPTASPR